MQVGRGEQTVAVQTDPLPSPTVWLPSRLPKSSGRGRSYRLGLPNPQARPCQSETMTR